MPRSVDILHTEGFELYQHCGKLIVRPVRGRRVRAQLLQRQENLGLGTFWAMSRPPLRFLV